MTGKTIIPFGFAMLCAGAAYAQAPIPITPGVPMQGEITDSSPRTERDQKHACYVLDAAPGSVWQIDMSARFDSFLAIGRGANCAGAEWLYSNDAAGFGRNDARMRFTAGGGLYVIAASNFYGGNGAFTLTAAETPGGESDTTLSAGLPSGATAGAAMAQAGGPAILQPGAPITGQISGASALTPILTSANRERPYERIARYDCYQWTAEPGTWQIALNSLDYADSLLALGRGDSCATVAQWDWMRDHTSAGKQTQATVTVEGGTYLVLAGLSDGADTVQGAYVLEVGPGTADRIDVALPAGPAQLAQTSPTLSPGAPASATAPRVFRDNQILLSPGARMQGVVDNSDPRSAGGNWPHDCYVLPTAAGERWELDLTGNNDTWLAVGRGQDCAEISTFDLVNDDLSGFFTSDLRRSRLRFTAGGDLYLVFVGFFQGGRGSYTLTTRRDPSISPEGTLPPGVKPLPPVLAGTASTAAPSLNAASYTPGQSFRDCDACPDMVVIPAGTFMMGSPETEEGRTSQEGPQHRVIIGRAFAMGKMEVTFDEYDACVTEGGCEAVTDDEGWGRGRRPVINVTYEAAQRYAAWLSAKTGAQYFLPSEAEWEYVARAGTTTPWNTGTAIITADANFLDQFGRTVAVGSYPPNAFGLHDMHGNVLEWTQDCMDTGYLGAPTDGSAAAQPDCTTQRIYRGGHYKNPPAFVRSAARWVVGDDADGADRALGFRVARGL